MKTKASAQKMPAELKNLLTRRIKELREAGEDNSADDMQLALLYFGNADARRMITDMVASHAGC